MKRRVLYKLLMTFAIAVSSCSKDFLSKNPSDAVSSGIYWQTQDDAVRAVTYCYSYIGDFDNRIFLSCATDDSYSWSNWPSDIQYAGNGSATATTGVFEHFWQVLYQAIAASNNVLDNIGKIPSEQISDSLRSRLSAEARFIRAYSYQQLTGMYGAVPLITHIQPTDSFDVSRTSADTISNFIVNELKDAASNLPLSYGSADYGHVTKGAALALLAREELYVGNWTDAAATAKQVMDLGQYSIDNSSDNAYNSLFDGTNKTSPEIILSAQYIKNTYPTGIATWVGGPTVGGWSQVVPLQGLVDAYECTDGKPITESSLYDPNHPYDNRDPRLKFTVAVPGSVINGKIINVADSNSIDALGKNNASLSGYYYKKYVPADISGDYNNNSYNDEVLIRYAEVLLTYAEAKIESNSIDQSVYDAINLIRQRRGVNMPAVQPGLSQSALRMLVRNERHVELAMEGLRLFDIRRWKIGEQVMNGNAYGILNNYNKSRGDYGSHVLVEKRSFVARDYLWAIPQNQIDLSHKLTQNTGW
ncbi:carbohydrate-binding protein SusD [Arachidicoccus ginsenosidimutans]|uniref:RagB/SusD family nutrient uptake outer membrane protein n=1 Tax=Arachidicoccus sp. BS20 TaxID=1850526 RepID=UPI0007F0DEC5|nr:RagB/SusD family nutrient uptake outer membrane protein [Arachidicoccus sp. BS20]ANI89073.1 carbohydrate-binding protein SusD [Arachidicoccus sp. BS20]